MQVGGRGVQIRKGGGGGPQKIQKLISRGDYLERDSMSKKGSLVNNEILNNVHM